MKGSITLLLTAVVGLSACASVSKEMDGLRDVDTLVNRIEHVHVETELAQARSHEALASLRTIVDPDFAGDSLASFGEFVDALERSEDQADLLRQSVKPMQKSADSVFERWSEDLDAFSSPAMRRRSEDRLETSRARFESVVAAHETAQAAIDAFNLGLRDHVIYLEHDFNPGSVAEIQDEVALLDQRIEGLDVDIAASLAASRQYVQASALPRRLMAGPTTVARARD